MSAWLGCLTTLLATQTTPPPFPLEALKGSGYDYTEKERSYNVVIPVPDTDAKMRIVLLKPVQSWLSLEGIDVLVIVWDSPTEPSQALLTTAFQRMRAVGGLVFEPPSERQPRWRINYRNTARADIDAEGMKSLLFTTAVAAEMIVKELKAAEVAK